MNRRQQIVSVALTVGAIFFVVVFFFLGIGFFLVIVGIGLAITAIIVVIALVFGYLGKRTAKK